jgi:DNA mismatch repair protein MutS2
MVRDARKEALDIVMSTRVELEKLVREIKVAQAEKAVIKKAREALNEKKELFEKELAAVEARPELAPGQIKAGAMVRIKSLARDGRIVSVRENSRVLVELPGGLRVETGCEDLSAPGEKKAKRPVNRVTWKTSESEPVSTELMIRGLEKVEALEEVDLFIDRAVLQGLDTVRIIHGIGRGILRQAVYDMLKTDPRVADIRPGEAAVGGDGVAVVRLR